MGVDAQEDKVKIINEGRSPIIEKDLDESSNNSVRLYKCRDIIIYQGPLFPQIRIIKNPVKILSPRYVKTAEMIFTRTIHSSHTS